MEKYTGSYFRFIFKDSKNWKGIAAFLFLYLFVFISSGFAAPSHWFLIPLALMVFITIKTYNENKKGTSS
jgi:hypothetical protein